MKLFLSLYTIIFISLTPAVAGTRIVVWNAEAALYEKIEKRISDFARFAKIAKPDVLVLIEMNGEHSVQAIAQQLNWNEYYSITSNLSELRNTVYSALEVAVISKIPIINAIEFDTDKSKFPDGTHSIKTQTGKIGNPIIEQELSADGIAGYGSTLKHTDRGTLRVDLENGLTIFPVHLKSNRINRQKCNLAKNTSKFIKDHGFELTPTLENQLSLAQQKGFNAITEARKKNALKRERVIAATVIEAEKAIKENRKVIIAGDFNTALEEGKAGNEISDCELEHFNCEPNIFPRDKCIGDGFDDTLGILTHGLVGSTKWKLLSENLDRTYTKTKYVNKAIDHIAVPIQNTKYFSDALKIEDSNDDENVFGSDHFPILTIYSEY